MALYKGYQKGEEVIASFGAGEKPIHGSYVEEVDGKAAIDIKLESLLPGGTLPRGTSRMYLSFDHLRPAKGFK